MNAQFCEKEQTVVATKHAGALNPELLNHASSCPVCSEVLLVMEALQDEGTSLDHELYIPDAALIWCKAQARAREQAMARATLPIRIAKMGAELLGVLAAIWMIFELSRHAAWIPDLGLKHFSMNATWLDALTGVTLLGITATLVCVGLGSWYMLREE